MLSVTSDYPTLYRDFSWSVPEHYNIADDVCERWAGDSNRTALIWQDPAGTQKTYSFLAMSKLSNRFANVLQADGMERGDRVAILLSQQPETPVAHLAAWKCGMISVPLFTLFGAEALAYRLGNSGAKALVTDNAGLQVITAIRHQLPELQKIYVIDDVEGRSQEGVEDFYQALAASSDSFTTCRTSANDPALIIYTSGTTGQPKGALHAHRVLPGHIPGVQMAFNLFPHLDDVVWTPADWAWIGGLLDVLMPAWHFGLPVVACRFGKFDPEKALQLMADLKVTTSFLPPTALKMMRGVKDIRQRFDLSLRNVGSGGEGLGAEMLLWGEQHLGVTINEFYGQTECNMVLSSCSPLFPARSGCIGQPVPGHNVVIINDDGEEVAQGQRGHIAVQSPDPVMFLEYWNNPKATRSKFIGNWLITGDQGVKEEDGSIRFIGREDDVITSSGYRIGPGEIEDCLVGHPAVQMAAAIGVPDPKRTEIVKALVVLEPGQQGSEALKEELQDHVRQRLAAHEYPRLLEFVDSLPLTTTGKIMRRVLREAEGIKEGAGS